MWAAFSTSGIAWRTNVPQGAGAEFLRLLPAEASVLASCQSWFNRRIASRFACCDWPPMPGEAAMRSSAASRSSRLEPK